MTTKLQLATNLHDLLLDKAKKPTSEFSSRNYEMTSKMGVILDLYRINNRIYLVSGSTGVLNLDLSEFSFENLINVLYTVINCL